MFVGSGVWSAPAMVATSGEGSCQTALDDKAFFYFQSDDVPTQFFAPQETYEGDLGVLSKARCELPKLDVYKSWHYHENVEEYERVWKLCKPGTQPHSRFRPEHVKLYKKAWLKYVPEEYRQKTGTDRPLDPLLRQNQIVGGPSNQATTPQPVNVAWSDPRRHSDDGPSSVGGGGEAATRFAASRRASAALSRSRVVGLRHRPMQDRDFRNLSTTRSTGSAGGGRLPPPTATSRLSRRRFGLIPIGCSSTAVKLVLFASHPNDNATAKTLQEMGETVSHIIALDAVHHLYLSDYLKIYPNAKVVGPKALVSKRSELKFDMVQPDSPLDRELAQEFKAVALTGHPNEDIVWLHTPSKTLIEAAALFNLPCDAQKSGIFAYIFPNFFLKQMSPNTGFHRTVVKAFSKSNPNAFADSAKIIDSWDFDRLIPCHGEIITPSTTLSTSTTSSATSGSTIKAAKAAWRNAYSSVMEQHSKTN